VTRLVKRNSRTIGGGVSDLAGDVRTSLV
jgi:hypothetical protein